MLPHPYTFRTIELKYKALLITQINIITVISTHCWSPMKMLWFLVLNEQPWLNSDSSLISITLLKSLYQVLSLYKPIFHIVSYGIVVRIQ